MVDLIITVKGYVAIARDYQLEAQVADYVAHKMPTKEHKDAAVMSKANAMRCFRKAAELQGDTSPMAGQIMLLDVTE